MYLDKPPRVIDTRVFSRMPEKFRRKGEPVFVPRQKDDVACIVYSSGTGGRPKGCVLTHENYLEQCKAQRAWQESPIQTCPVHERP